MTYTVMFSAVAGYLINIQVLTKYMSNKQAYDLKYAMMVYNILQILSNAYIVYGISSIISFQNFFGLNTQYNDRLRYFVYLHYISKYADFFDTFFIVLRKKNNQLSFLHVYHHSSISLFWGFLLHIGHGNGTVAFGAWINSIIHTIMYSHYYYTSLGYTNPLKKYITQAQMVQFVLCIVHSLTVMCFEQIVPRRLAIAEIVYMMQMIYLFSKFYKKSY